MYGIFIYIDNKFMIIVGKHSIHEAYELLLFAFSRSVDVDGVGLLVSGIASEFMCARV